MFTKTFAILVHQNLTRKTQVLPFCEFMQFYYDTAVLLAMQSAVLATALPSVRLSVRACTLVLYPDE